MVYLIRLKSYQISTIYYKKEWRYNMFHAELLRNWETEKQKKRMDMGMHTYISILLLILIKNIHTYF